MGIGNVPQVAKYDVPLKPPQEKKRRTLAPAWMSLASAWLGLFCVILSAAVPFVPGSSDPQAELTHLKPYSTADRLIVVAIYLSPASMCLGIIVLWQMANEARPLPQALINQRVQA